MAAAAAAEVQTELAARVAGWRTKIGPVLEEQDARGDFDIHTYAFISVDSTPHSQTPFSGDTLYCQTRHLSLFLSPTVRHLLIHMLPG